ncbi:hypothetical protein DPEC_G00153170 [Dallia pectoralis]|uniref:Uncharacterized protein n=1 Tax=Dallia pectoralis TaxID=75939 RepID=A0ACC2GJG4_DALPE|nr:hypothetical protein DPEC_G00153170 [Dallia pectoralis]
MLEEGVRYEALSVAMGARVRPLSEFVQSNPGKTPDVVLTVAGFLIGSVLGLTSLLDWLNPVSWLTWGLSKLFFREQNESNATKTEIYVDEASFFDRQYDYDFTRVSDNKPYWRGDEEYKRPCGWTRIALKVLDKYGDNIWLGPNGIRTESIAGEWPVSYHGTSEDGAKGIIQSNYRAGDRQLYGRGIYSTPDLDQASGYAREFVSKTNKKKYRIVLQNRINPTYRQICKRVDYWLVPVQDGTSVADERTCGALHPALWDSAQGG